MKIRGVYEYPKGSGVWWIQFFANGKRHREKVGKKAWAIKRLDIRKAEVLFGKFFPARGGSTVEQIAELTYEDYRRNRKKVRAIDSCWHRIKPILGMRQAAAVTTEDLHAYIEAQMKAGLSNATVNRDMAFLKRSYKLATQMTPPKVPRVPIFPAQLKESPPRSGFIEDAQYYKLLDHAREPWLKAFIGIAYHWGLRREEIIGLQVMQVEKDFIRLRPGETKNDEGRVAPLTEHLRELLAPCLDGKRPHDLVLTRGARAVRDFRSTWETVTAAAGVTGLLPHDLRRSAVRNMVNSGIPEKTAMAISGHLTREVFDRYNIVSESDILKAGRKLEKASLPSGTNTATSKLAEKERKPMKVVSIRRAAS